MTDKVEEGDKEVEKQEEGQVEQTPSLSPLEQQASSFGWLPKEEWVKAGHEEGDWAPAKHFMKVGELKKQVIEREKAITKQDKLIKVMKNHHLNVKQTAYEDALKTLKAERETALEANDLVQAERIRDRIEETKEKQAKDRVLPAEVEREIEEINRQQPAQQTTPPEFYEFLDRNPWYITDPKKQDEISREADKIGVAEAIILQRDGKAVEPEAIYRLVETKIKKLYPEKFGTPKSPQSSGSKQSDKGDGKSTKLSDEELAVAKSFGLSPEKYAAELKGYKGR